MTAPSLTPAVYDIEPHRAELAAMLRLLSMGQGGFSLGIAVCNAPQLRDQLIDEVRQRVSNLVTLSIPAGTVDVYGFVAAQSEVQEAGSLFLIGLEASVSDADRDQHTLRSLNASRDLWADAFQLPVIFWVPEYAARALSETARDFWRIRSHRFSFLIHEELSATQSVSPSLGGFSAAMSLALDEKQARIAELERRIIQAGTPTSETRSHVFDWLGELFALYFELGDLISAESALQRRSDLSSPDSETAETAATLGNLATVYFTRGELTRAEEMYKRTLAICEKVDDRELLASTYGNLGLIYRRQGDLPKAVEMHWKAIEIDGKDGRPEGVAFQWSGLGVIYQLQGDLSRAEEMHRNALSIHEKLGCRREIATDYANLGSVYSERGDLARAEEMHRNALNIYEILGRQHGISNEYAVLGLIAKERGNLTSARELLSKARDLFAQIGMPHMVKQAQRDLDLLPVGSDE